MKYFPALLLSCLLISCSGSDYKSDATDPLLVLHDASTTGIDFSNEIFETTDLNILTFEYLYNGAGVAVADFNGDLLPDLYFAGNMVNGKLYLNRGDFHFEDITEQAGISTDRKWGTGVSVVDINDDGRLDLYLCFAGPYGPDRRENMLYINKGPQNKDDPYGAVYFEEQAEAYGLNDNAHTTHAAFFDYDKDGDLDVYLLNNITDETGPNIIRPKRLKGEMPNTDRLYRNDNGLFTNVSTIAGILKEGYGLGVAIGDINQDNWPDIYVSNDYLSNDLLYINNQDGTFTDRAADWLRHTSYSSMGCDLADFNNDGRLDIAAVDMLPPDHTRRKLMMGSINYNRFLSEIRSGYFPQYMRNTLQLNQGADTHGDILFSEIGQLAGMQSTDWSWSPLFQDMDNDGLRDLLITNGYPRDITNMDFAAYKASLMMNQQYNEQVLQQLIAAVNQVKGAYLPNYVFQNQGDLRFRDRSADWGFTQPSFSHGAAVADLDGDGDLDYITNNSYDAVFIYENRARQQNGNHFLKLQLDGPDGNGMGIGTKITVFQQGSKQYYEHYPYRGYQSSIDPIIHFGLGTNAAVDSIVVQWPDDKQQTIVQPLIDQFMIIGHLPQTAAGSNPQPKPSLYAAVTDRLGCNFQHQEPHYDDFKVSPLLPHKQSQDGPCLSIGDLNGDQLEDFFVGGAFRQSGMIFLQKNDGTFNGYELDPANATAEDLGSVLFDADQDGDLDLYVTSGSNEFPIGSEYYQDRLYYNDGAGHFTLRANALPKMTTSTSCVTAADMDQDGDLDLFVGGRTVPGRYPEVPRSYLLENQGNSFVDVTVEKAPKLANIGMLTDASWTDQDQDGWPDLVLAGEWQPISYWKNESGRFTDQTEAAGLSGTTGWWNRLIVADIDQDGDEDLVAGNLGWNSQHQVRQDRPLSLFVGDFDKNDVPDPIIAHYLEDRFAPLPFRDDLRNWMLPLKKRFQDYQSYADTDWQDLFPNQPVARIDAQWFASSWIENLGNGQYTVHPLPLEAQLAPVFGILATDLNEDGKTDLLLSGNTSAPNPHEGRYDAFNGLLLLSDGQGKFTPMHLQESGIILNGEGRDLGIIRVKGKQLLIATQNNGPMQMYQTVRSAQEAQ